MTGLIMHILLYYIVYSDYDEKTYSATKTCIIF